MDDITDTPYCSEIVIARIESLIQAIVDEIVEDKEELLIRLSRRGIERGQSQDAAISSAVGTSDVQTREIRFPGATPREAWTFSELELRAGNANTHSVCRCDYPDLGNDAQRSGPRFDHDEKVSATR